MIAASFRLLSAASLASSSVGRLGFLVDASAMLMSGPKAVGVGRSVIHHRHISIGFIRNIRNNAVRNSSDRGNIPTIPSIPTWRSVRPGRTGINHEMRNHSDRGNRLPRLHDSPEAGHANHFAKSLGPGETDCTDCADCKVGVATVVWMHLATISGSCKSFCEITRTEGNRLPRPPDCPFTPV